MYNFCYGDTVKVTKPWVSSEALPECCIEQFERFKKHLNDCKSIGVLAADKNIAETDDTMEDCKCDEFDQNEQFIPDFNEALKERDKIVTLCKN